MSRGQIVILLGLTLVVCAAFVVLGALLLLPGILPTGVSPGEGVIASGDGEGAAAGEFSSAEPPAASTPTATPFPTSTPTETPLPEPTATATLVVITTPTATKEPTQPFSFQPGGQPTATATPVVSSGGGSSGGGGTSTGGGGSSVATSTPTPGSRFPLQVVEGPLTYSTENHIFVVYFAITDAGNNPLPGYRVVGQFRPGGFYLESVESCGEFCVASGPAETCVPINDDDNNDEDKCEVIKFSIQQGNVVFEAPFYVTGTWTLYVVDRLGARVSDDLVFNTNQADDQRQWFYVKLIR
ncbi:MAG: hypothetical protein ACE5H9_13990 [Anaerolineae bacterium]